MTNKRHQASSANGIIPAGIWVMDEKRSTKLVPAALTLWVVRDDGEQLVWVSVETEKDGTVKVNCFNGFYGGAPVAVLGNGFVVSLESPAPRQVRVSGTVPGMGAFEEVSEISPDGRTMIVNGKVLASENAPVWHEEFDWHGPSPHAPDRLNGN